MTQEQKDQLLKWIEEEKYSPFAHLTSKEQKVINVERLKAKIFLQPDVSGNEANPKENKKVGEVALLFFEWEGKKEYPLILILNIIDEHLKNNNYGLAKTSLRILYKQVFEKSFPQKNVNDR